MEGVSALKEQKANMINNYEYTELAINDIDETLNYITNNLCNKKAVIDLIQYIEKCIQNNC